MNRPDFAQLDELKVDIKNLYREEVFTDLNFATVRQLTPVNADGKTDSMRDVLFFGQTQMMTPEGSIPIQFHIDARDLRHALELFPEAVKKTLSEVIESAKEAQRQAESRIVVPGGNPGGKITLG